MATAFYHSSQTGNHGILDNQYSEDEDYDPSGDEDDGFTFKTAVKLPHSEVSKKKLGELVGRYLPGNGFSQSYLKRP